MKHFYSTALVTCLLSARAVFGHSAVEPTPRGDQGWKDRQASFNKKVAEVGKKAQVIFIGDSITHGWEGDDAKGIWAENFAKYDAINLGIGGDRTQHVLWRLDNGNLEGLSPKAAVLMIGTNNSNAEDNTAEQIAEGVREIVRKLRTKIPTMKVIILPIFPRGENPNPQRGKILQANQIIQKLVDGENVLWVDFGHKFIDEEGRIPRDIMPDFLHLSKKGYEIWAESLREPLSQAVGEKTAGNEGSRGNISGTWTAFLPGPNNETVEIPFTVKQEGSKIEGAFQPEGRELKIEEGKISGKDLTWRVKRQRQNGETMVYKMRGTVEGDKITGTTVTEVEGNETTIAWTASRRK